MQKYGVVNTDVLNLRAGPSTTAQVVATLPTGTILNIVADPGFDWLQVTVDGVGTQGYVSKTYLTLTDTKPSSPAGPAAPSVPASPPATTPPAMPTPPTPPTAAVSPAPAAPPPISTSSAAPIIGKGEVTTDSLNVRSGPGTTFQVLRAVVQGTVINVLEKDGDWTKVRVGNTEGFVSAQYLDLNTTKPVSSSGYLIEQADLLVANLPPDKLIPDQTPSTKQAVLARTWNQYGGFLSRLSTLLGCPVDGIVATLTAESGGNCFGPDGKIIIRFENHIFWNYWGQAHPDIFNQYFQFDRSSGANAWKGHMFRPDANSPWQAFHGKQASEYQVLTIARALDDTAALESISMGAPQVMGFNYRRLGYDSVQSMFYQFTRSANAQLLAMFDFVRGTSSSSPAIDALKNRDYLAFANIYNGSANAPTYRDIIAGYVSIFDSLVKS